MLIVTQGKVDGKSRGEVLDGLTPEQEKRLVEMGVAAPPDQAEGAPATRQAAKPPTKADLQARCRDLGLSDKGNKDELQARIDAKLADDGDEDYDDADGDGDDDDMPDLTPEVPR